MPPLEHKDFHDPAVLWAYVRTGRDGDPLVSDAVQIMTRWEDGQIEIPNPDGSYLTVDATIATNRNIPLNSIIWEGEKRLDGTFLSFQDGTEYPSTGPTREIYEVVTRMRGEDIRGRIQRFEFGLRRYKDTLPRIVG